jgi:predicted aspartyl protease
MEIATMGKVKVAAAIENLNDLFQVDQGTRQPEEVRRLDVPDALVDTGATLLSLPQKYVQQLGLKRFGSRAANTSGGLLTFDLYGTVQLTVQGRQCRVDVAVVPDNCPVLIGQIPLEYLDFVVDPKGQRLVGNPEHGGEHMIDLF